MKKLFANGILYSVIIIAIALLSGCSDDNPVTIKTYDAYSVNGTISFVDTLVNTSILNDTTNGYYSISAFAVWPPVANASATAKIYPVKIGGKYTANYILVLPSNGSYTITTAYIRIPYVPFSSVLGLGIYDTTPGNDTTHNVGTVGGPHTKAVISNGTGIGNINFNSWIDTTKKIYKF